MNLSKGARIILALILSALAPVLFANQPVQSEYPKGHFLFRTYGTAEGLANVSVLNLLQDRDGFVWVGTDDGLYRFDGYRFDAFGLAQGLPSTSIDTMHEDGAGIVWIGTRHGLARWNGAKFEQLGTANGLPETDITALADRNASIWVGTPLGPYLGSGEERFRLAARWPGGEVTALHGGQAGMWVAQWQGKATVWQWRDDGWHRYESPQTEQHERIDAMVEDKQGQVFARTARSLWKLSPSAENFTQLETPKPLIAQRGFLKLGRDGELWVPTDDAGLLNLKDGRWTVDPRAPFPSTRAILEDAEGSLWFGTTGLNRLLGRGAIHSYATLQGLPGNVPWSIFRDQQKNLWVGTNLGLARQVGERFVVVRGTEAHTIRAIVQAPDGSFYLAGLPGNDVMHFNPETQALDIHQLASDNPSKRIYRMLLDDQGMLWVGTEGAGMLNADIHVQPLQFSRVSLPEGTPTENVSDLHKDRAGRLWIAGQRGIAMLEASKWRRFTTKDGLRDNSIAYVRSAANGDLLIVYFEPLGFTRARYENGTLRVIKHYDYESNATANKIFLIGEDNRQRLWIGGGRGVDLLGPSGTEHFGTREGLIGEDTTSMAFLAEHNGDVWIGSVGGLSRFDAHKYDSLPALKPPTTELLSVTFGKHIYRSDLTGTKVSYRDNSFAVRYAGMSYLAEGTMRYRVRLHGLESESIVSDGREARYAALPPGTYRFEVEAQADPHAAWGPASNFSFAVLPAWWQTWWFRTLIAFLLGVLLLLAVRWRLAALSAQNLVLEQHVASRTSELRDSNLALQHANSSLQDEIAERSAAEMAVQHRNIELQNLNEKLAGTQSQLLQSEKMASVGQLAAGVAHEINNPVGYVYSNFGSLDHYVQKMFSLLSAYQLLEGTLPPEHPEVQKLSALKAAIDFDYLVSDTANLLTESREGLERIQKIVKDLKDFSHVGVPEWQLADIHHSIDSTLNVIASELKYKVVLIKEYATLPKIRCLPFQLNQVFLNLLINASHSIKEQGRITIQTGCTDEHVWVRITDTGQGISAANLSRIFEPFFTTKPIGVGTGLGLSVSWGIVHAHAGRIDVESELNRGTVFTVFLPINAMTQTIAA